MQNQTGRNIIRWWLDRRGGVGAGTSVMELLQVALIDARFDEALKDTNKRVGRILAHHFVQGIASSRLQPESLSEDPYETTAVLTDF